MFYALNGTVPQSIAYNRTPIDQISALYPSYPLSEIISGAM
jgi:hypothetical protein